MPDCDYCGASFGSQDALDSHLKSTHADELGPIDRRRLDVDDDGEGVLSEFAGPIAIGAVVLLAAAVVGYVVASPGGSKEPTNLGSVHHHGPINVTVLGDTVDFTEPRWKHPRESPAFHFEARNDPRWHVHAQQVTLKYAMGTLGFEVTHDSFTFENTTYRDDSPDYRVTVEVDGNDVDPSKYVLKPGDRIEIVVARE